jgi:hypothetical protein
MRSATRLVPPGTETARKVARTFASLSVEPVPGPDDEPDFLAALAIMFVRRGDEIHVLGVRIWP